MKVLATPCWLPRSFRRSIPKAAIFIHACRLCKGVGESNRPRLQEKSTWRLVRACARVGEHVAPCLCLQTDQAPRAFPCQHSMRRRLHPRSVGTAVLVSISFDGEFTEHILQTVVLISLTEVISWPAGQVAMLPHVRGVQAVVRAT